MRHSDSGKRFLDALSVVPNQVDEIEPEVGRDEPFSVERIIASGLLSGDVQEVLVVVWYYLRKCNLRETGVAIDLSHTQVRRILNELIERYG